MGESVSKYSLYIGLLRPKTLFSGLSPIIVALAYACSRQSVSWLMATLLVIIAISAQIASNIANDWIDYKKGADTEDRTGPLRPLSKGLLSEREVKVALMISVLILLLAGGAVIALTSWWLLFVGLVVVLGVFAYSGGPYPLSYHGLGDIAVLLFFGWIPVIVSHYVLTGSWGGGTLYMLATSIGLASVNILVVNNYRDYEEDRKVGKRTLIVRMGREFAHHLYLSCALSSLLLLFPIYSLWSMWLLPVYGYAMVQAYRGLRQSDGTALNRVLGYTARNVFLLSLLIAIFIYLKM